MYLSYLDFPKIACGLNIEGCRPVDHLPSGCRWYNLVQAIDQPLQGQTFDWVMSQVRQHQYPLIEQAVGIDPDILLNQLANLLDRLKAVHRQILVHVHQSVGTTLLAERLHQRTQLPIILDPVDYHHTPVDYRQSYPNIDALVSLSQCAGLGVAAGTWIIPSQFLRYDVTNRVIYTTPILADNGIKPHVDFPFVEGPILFVDDLWNPDVSPDSSDSFNSSNSTDSWLNGAILLDSKASQVLDFVLRNTQMFDESHNWRHALNVAYNAMKIASTESSLSDNQRTGLLYLALLHDVCDHKYPEAIPRDDLSKWIASNLPDYPEIDHLIDQISFSKEQKDRQNGNFRLVNPVLDIIRDADRLEALGTVGVQRCIEFTKSKGGKIPEDVVVHCHQKLLRLLPENYIITTAGREEGNKRETAVWDYIRSNQITCIGGMMSP